MKNLLALLFVTSFVVPLALQIPAGWSEPSAIESGEVILPVGVRPIIILNDPIDTGDKRQPLDFQGVLKDDVSLEDGTCLPAKTKVIGYVLPESRKGGGRTTYVVVGFRKIIFPDGREKKLVAIPSVRAGVLHIRNDGADIALDAQSGNWHSEFHDTKNGAERVLLVPVTRIIPKKGKEIHLKPGDEFQIEHAAEIHTTIEELSRTGLRL
jgi:hypothetical protein